MSGREFTEAEKTRYVVGTVGYALVLSLCVFAGIIAALRDWDTTTLAATGAFVSTLSLALRHMVQGLTPREPIEVPLRRWSNF